jgi:hypothetical protein
VTDLARLHWRMTLAALASLLIIVILAIASNREWIPRPLGALLIIVWIPVLALLVLGSRILGNLRLVGQPALRSDSAKRTLIGSLVGVVLGLILIVLTYILTR